MEDIYHIESDITKRSDDILGNSVSCLIWQPYRMYIIQEFVEMLIQYHRGNGDSRQFIYDSFIQGEFKVHL